MLEQQLASAGVAMCRGQMQGRRARVVLQVDSVGVRRLAREQQLQHVDVARVRTLSNKTMHD